MCESFLEQSSPLVFAGIMEMAGIKAWVAVAQTSKRALGKMHRFVDERGQRSHQRQQMAWAVEVFSGLPPTNTQRQLALWAASLGFVEAVREILSPPPPPSHKETLFFDACKEATGPGLEAIANAIGITAKTMTSVFRENCLSNVCWSKAPGSVEYFVRAFGVTRQDIFNGNNNVEGVCMGRDLPGLRFLVDRFALTEDIFFGHGICVFFNVCTSGKKEIAAFLLERFPGALELLNTDLMSCPACKLHYGGRNAHPGWLVSTEDNHQTIPHPRCIDDLLVRTTGERHFETLKILWNAAYEGRGPMSFYARQALVAALEVGATDCFEYLLARIPPLSQESALSILRGVAGFTGEREFNLLVDAAGHEAFCQSGTAVKCLILACLRDNLRIARLVAYEYNVPLAQVKDAFLADLDCYPKNMRPIARNCLRATYGADALP